MAVSAVCLAQSSSEKDLASEKEALVSLTRRFYQTFESETLEGQWDIWSPRSTDPSADREQRTKSRAQMENVRLVKFDAYDVKINGDKARVRLIVNVSATWKQNGKPVRGWMSRDAQLTHRYVREEGKWRLIEITGTDEDMTEELAEMETSAERERYIAERPELVNVEFISNLGSYGMGYGQKFGDRQKGLELTLLAMRLAEKLGDREMISQTAAFLANIYMWLGDHGLALHYDQMHYELERTLGEKGNPRNALNSIGGTYAALGDIRRALEYYEKSLSLNSSSIMVRGNIASSALEMGDLDRAAKEFELVLDAVQKIPDPTRKNEARGDVAKAQLGLAQVAQRRGDLQKALELSMKVYEESKDFTDKGFLNWLNKQIGEIQLQLKAYPQAIRHAREAVEFADQMGVPDLAWDAHLTIARAHLGLGQKAEARAELEKSIAIIEQMRSRVLGGEESQQRFFDSKSAPYAELASLLLSEGKIEESFRIGEQIKGRTLLSVLSGGRPSLSGALNSSEKAEERKLVERIAEVNTRLRVERDDSKQPALQAELEKARQEYELFRNRLYATHPELRARQAEFPEIDLKEAALLAGPDTAILSFVVSDDKLLVFTAGGQQDLKAIAVPIRQDDLAKKINAFREGIASGDLRFQQSAKQLFDLILKPVDSGLAGKGRLIIIPDGPLWDLPFQALMDPRGQYLVDRVAVSYAPSLTALREMSKKAKSRKGAGGLELLAFGNPVVGGETATRVKRVFMSEKLDPLPEAERLVNELGRMYGPGRSRVLTGAAAREEVAKSEAPKYRIVQLATHGILNNVSPMYSHLVLAQGDKASGEDGLLEAWEMKDLNLNADMVILSACETARGKVSRGEGMIGMTWAAFIAGAPTTVASQWRVESRSTTELMLEFHRQMLSGKVSKAEALRRAALKLKRTREFSHPSYWAGFVIVGDAN